MRFAVPIGLIAFLAASGGTLAAYPLPSGYRYPDPPGTCDCTDIPTTDAPVCGTDHNTYGNDCIAQCANIVIVSEGACPNCAIQTNNCQCGVLPYSPVCGLGLTWDSECDALCGGYSCYTQGVCIYNDQGTFTPTTGGSSSAAGAKAAASDSTMPDPSAAKYDYAEGLHKTLLFFESMRSGVLDRQRLAWRSDSCFNCKGPGGEDVSGGYYEAGGSFLKLGIVEAFLVTLLGYALDTFPQGFAKGDLQNALDGLEWGASYLVAAHSAPNQFVAVVGNSTLDFNYYGPVEEYENFVASRPSCYINEANPSSEIAGEAAAGLAAAYVVLGANKAVSASTLSSYLTHAEQLYTLATTHQGSYQTLTDDPCLKQLGMLYASTGYVDELAWAAAWLFKATGNQQYLTDAKTYYAKTCRNTCYSFETGEKGPALNVLMAAIDPANAGEYNANAANFFNLYLQQTIPYTPGGLAYPYHWGALRPTTQAAFLALVESQQLRKSNPSYSANLMNWAISQVIYVLGDSGRSWLAGFGTDYPTYIWHKLSYNSYIDWPTRGVTVFANWSQEQTDGTYKTLLNGPLAKFDMESSRTPQRFIPYGALWGAPLEDDGLVVSRKDFTYAEATTDGTSGITGALAALTQYFSTSPNVTPQTDCGLDLGWTHPNATNSAKSINNTAVCLGLAATGPNPPSAPTPRPAPAVTVKPVAAPTPAPTPKPVAPVVATPKPVAAPTAIPTAAPLSKPVAIPVTSGTGGSPKPTAPAPSPAPSGPVSSPTPVPVTAPAMPTPTPVPVAPKPESAPVSPAPVAAAPIKPTAVPVTAAPVAPKPVAAAGPTPGPVAASSPVVVIPIVVPGTTTMQQQPPPPSFAGAARGGASPPPPVTAASAPVSPPPLVTASSGPSLSPPPPVSPAVSAAPTAVPATTTTGTPPPTAAVDTSAATAEAPAPAPSSATALGGGASPAVLAAISAVAAFVLAAAL